MTAKNLEHAKITASKNTLKIDKEHKIKLKESLDNNVILEELFYFEAP